MAINNLAMIAACDPNGVIGNRGKLPWNRLENDLKRFKELTHKKILIMGRKTVESLPSALPERTIIQVSRKSALPNYSFMGLAEDGEDRKYRSSVTNLGAAVGLAISMRERGSDEVLIAGGGEVYRWAWEHVNKLYLTVAKAEYEGDVVMEEFARLISGKDFTWNCIHHQSFSDNDYYIYTRNSNHLYIKHDLSKD